MRIFIVTILASLIAVTTFVCAASGVMADDQIVPKVTYCELIKHPERFDDRVVEVTAIYGNAFEKSYLYDKENCKGGISSPRTWAGFHSSFVQDGETEEAKTNSNISGFGVWEVTAIGRFKRAKGPQRFGHLGCCLYQFDFMKVLSSRKLSDRTR